MNHLKLIIFTLFLISNNLFAQTFPEPNPKTWVVDHAGIFFNPSVISEAMLSWERQHKTGVEYAVVTVPDMEGYEISDYANKLFNYYGIGKIGANNGLLILIAVKERKWRIEVGRGLEAIITDGEAKYIGEESINKEEFKAGNYDPSVLRMITALQEKIGTMSVEDKKEWINQQKIAEERKTDQAIQNFKDGVIDFIGWLLTIGSIGGVIFVLIKMFRRRKKAKKETKEIKSKIKTLVSRMNSTLAPHNKFKSVQKLLQDAATVDENTKVKIFWTKNIEKNTAHLTSQYENIYNRYQTIQENIKNRDKIDDLATSIRKSELKDWKQYNYVSSFFKYVAEIDNLDLDDDLISGYKQLTSKYNNVSKLVDIKKKIDRQVASIQKSDLGTKWINHPQVKEFVCDLNDYEQTDISNEIGDIYNEITSRYDSIIDDIEYRKKLTNSVVSFDKYDLLATKANNIINSLSLDKKFDDSYLNNAKAVYKTFETIKFGNIDLNWSKMKKAWCDITSYLDKHTTQVNQFIQIENNYKESLKSIPAISATIISSITDAERKIKKDGVSNSTKNSYNSIVNKWNGMNTKTSGLSVASTIALVATLNAIYSEVSNVIKKAKREHDDHLEEIEEAKREAERLARKKRDDEERNSYSSSYSSSYDFGSSSDSSSYGGGDSGGGGADGSW